VDACNGIVQGLDWQNNRIGNMVKAHSFVIDGVITGGQTNVITDDNRNTVRFVVASAVPGFSWTGLTLSSILDPRMLNGLHRVLWDETFIMESPGRDSTGYLPAMKLITRKIHVHQQLVFSGSGITSQSDRSIWVAFVSDSAVAPSPGFVSGAMGLSYLDD